MLIESSHNQDGVKKLYLEAVQTHWDFFGHYSLVSWLKDAGGNLISQVIKIAKVSKHAHALRDALLLDSAYQRIGTRLRPVHDSLFSDWLCLFCLITACGMEAHCVGVWYAPYMHEFCAIPGLALRLLVTRSSILLA